MNDIIERAARIITPIIESDNDIYWASEYGRPMPQSSMQAIVCAVVKELREPTHAITRAMAESCAHDDEGDFPIMLDLLDFGGENKTHTALAQAWRDGIDAVLRDG